MAAAPRHVSFPHTQSIYKETDISYACISCCHAAVLVHTAAVEVYCFMYADTRGRFDDLFLFSPPGVGGLWVAVALITEIINNGNNPEDLPNADVHASQISIGVTDALRRQQLSYI